MLYVARDTEGNIVDLQPMPSGDAQEALANDHPDVLQFFHERWRRNELEELDRDFIRVIEDLIELLIAREVLMFTDLPAKVQEKMLRRKEVRQNTHYLGNIGAGGDDIIPI